MSPLPPIGDAALASGLLAGWLAIFALCDVLFSPDKIPSSLDTSFDTLSAVAAPLPIYLSIRFAIALVLENTPPVPLPAAKDAPKAFSVPTALVYVPIAAVWALVKSEHCDLLISLPQLYNPLGSDLSSGSLPT